jgi:hypothetical protein
MYYPYLRARQFELLALRELIQANTFQGKVIPILEPVKNSFNNLKLAFDAFRGFDQIVYLILNPENGDLKGDNVEIADYLNIVDTNSLSVRPAFLFKENATYIETIINSYSFSNCMLICPNNIDASDPGFNRLVNLSQITSFNIEDPAKNRSLNRLIKSTGKTYIRLDDQFEPEARNKDFLLKSERIFTEEHLYFEEEGFDGFSDFTVLPKDYIEGGGAPRAVVIHLTYQKDDDEKIWIRHFTSISNDSVVNVQGKFAEAAEKAVDFCRREGLSNNAIEELIEYYNQAHYPGLGMVKKISIKNHLEVVSQYLR